MVVVMNADVPHLSSLNMPIRMVAASRARYTGKYYYYYYYDYYYYYYYYYYYDYYYYNN